MFKIVRTFHCNDVCGTRGTEGPRGDQRPRGKSFTIERAIGRNATGPNVVCGNAMRPGMTVSRSVPGIMFLNGSHTWLAPQLPELAVVALGQTEEGPSGAA